MEHTKACIEYMSKLKKARDDYEVLYPDYCHVCQGTGEILYSYDPSPAGVSLSPGMMIDSDPCLECLQKGLCPRCRKPVPEWDVDFNESATCHFCGWQYLISLGCPVGDDECNCFDAWVDEQERLIEEKIDYNREEELS